MSDTTLFVGRRSKPLHFAYRFGVYLGLSLFAAFCAFPFAWMISTAFKPATQATTLPIEWIPSEPTLENFRMILSSREVGTLFKNTAIVASCSALFSTVIAGLAGYGLARLPLRRKSLIFQLILMTQMIPGVLLAVPFFIMFRNAGLLDSLLGLIVAYTALTLPITTWILRGYMARLPKELDEASLVDGCTRLQTLRYIIVPLAMPGIGAAFVFTFVVAWQEYLFALTLTTSKANEVITVGIAKTISQYTISWGEMMGLGILAVIPIAAIFFFIERYMVQGLASGAVKG